MTQLGIIRHGITDWNIQKRAQGQTDIPLNETGRKQALALAERLKDERWDLVYSSDLSRAKETAEIVAETLGLSVHTDIRLREKGFGEIEGLTMDDRLERWGQDWPTLAQGIESEASVVERAVSFAAHMIETYPQQRILVVSHGAFIARALAKFIPHENLDQVILNTSITKIRYADGRWVCDLLNCTKHIVL